MHDIVIRGGTVIDGTGTAAFTGDVAIADDRIAGVGGKQGPARREIDATGLMVTPGWSTYTRTTTGRRCGTHCSLPHVGMA
jgi:N-acyl-D-amino-acid deacylase